MADKAFKISNKYQYILLDLDNTLYDEKLYLYPGYKKIASTASKNYSLNALEVENFLISEFEKEGRRNLFNKLCARFSISETAVEDMLKTLRTIQLPSKIELFDKMKKLLDEFLSANKNLFVITNGNWEQQQNKVASINWEGRDQHIQFVYAANYKPKPDRGTFDYLLSTFKIVPQKTIFIGDSEVDSDFARNCEIDFWDVEEILKAAGK